MEMINGSGESNGTPSTPSSPSPLSSRLPPSLPTNSSSLRKSIIKISSNSRSETPEQRQLPREIKNLSMGKSVERTRIIPIYRSVSHQVDNADDNIDMLNKSPSSSAYTQHFNYKSPFNRINFVISSDPFSRTTPFPSRLNQIRSIINDRCHSSLSSGYESMNGNHSPSPDSSNFASTSPDRRFGGEIRRTSSANRLYTPVKSSIRQQNFVNNCYDHSTFDDSINANERNKKSQVAKRYSLQNGTIDAKEDILKTLDQVEKRVVFFREIASELFEEKSKLLDALNKIKSSRSPDSFTEVDRQDLQATTDHLLNRLESVDIFIKPVRSSSQVDAFNRVNQFIDGLNRIMAKEGKTKARKKCLTYISSCSSDELADYGEKESLGPIDEHFQKLIIECALEDQKLIKKKLESFLDQVKI